MFLNEYGYDGDCCSFLMLKGLAYHSSLHPTDLAFNTPPIPRFDLPQTIRLRCAVFFNQQLMMCNKNKHTKKDLYKEIHLQLYQI